jgi:hypothetical protein
MAFGSPGTRPRQPRRGLERISPAPDNNLNSVTLRIAASVDARPKHNREIIGHVDLEQLLGKSPNHSKPLQTSWGPLASNHSTGAVKSRIDPALRNRIVWHLWQAVIRAASVKYRNVNFEVDVLAMDTWRWTILARRASDLTLVGQAQGTRDQAIARCMAEIDAMLAREDRSEKR